MLYATKLRMNYGCQNSWHPADIDQIYIYEYGWYKKGDLHEHVKKHPGSIAVGIPPYPPLIPAISKNRERYVRSTPDEWKHDDLMDLPKE